ncbi:MAG: hypothetical protein WHX53_06520, partial [Anaerolineae bacterium]
LTGLQNRLLLADVYLKGGEFAKAEEIYAAILAEERGHPEALAGLKKAVEGRAAATATASAPRPAPTATPTAVTTFGETTSSRTNEIVGTALPLLLVIIILYLFAQVVRWLLFALREFYYLRILPFFHRPMRDRPFLIGEFTDATGLPNGAAPKIVTQTLTEQLLVRNRTLQAKESPVEPVPALDLGGMAWIKVLWTWILPPPRAFKVEGAIWTEQGTYKLAIRRTDLSTNAVDMTYTFSSAGPTPEAALQEMATEAAKWIVYPREMGASEALLRLAVRGEQAKAPVRSAGAIYDEAIRLLLPIRQQLDLATVDYADARERLRQAQALLTGLPENSRLYADLSLAIADLRRSVPGA